MKKYLFFSLVLLAISCQQQQTPQPSTPPPPVTSAPADTINVGLLVGKWQLLTIDSHDTTGTVIMHTDVASQLLITNQDAEYHNFTLNQNAVYVQGYDEIVTRRVIGGSEQPYSTNSWGICPSNCVTNKEILGLYNSSATYVPGGFPVIKLLTTDSLILFDPGACSNGQYGKSGTTKHFNR